MTVPGNFRQHCKLLLLCLVLLTSGCTLRITYPLLEWTSYWSLDDYMALDSAQKDYARQGIAELFDWHRRQELPLYAAELQALADDLEHPISTDQLAGYNDRMLLAWSRVMAQMLPTTVTLLAGFSDAQVQEMNRRMALREEEQAEEYRELSDPKRRNEHRKRMEKTLRRFTGRLDDQQQAMITQWSEDMLDLTDYYLAQSELWRNLFIQAMASRYDEVLFTAQLEVLFAVDGALWPQDYSLAMEHNRQTSLKLLRDVFNSLDERQRARAQKRLRGLADDLYYLAGQPLP